MIKYSASSFKTSLEAKEFVNLCDDDFTSRLSALTEQVCARENIKVITLSGPTCSGKTTASKKLLSDFKKFSKRVNILSIDDF